jgi:tripartite-type tricarboxylate transporter receptor subunit TctC
MRRSARLFAFRHCIILISIFVFTCLSTSFSNGQSDSSFYKGKQITLVIGYEAGGGYDLYGRLLARYLSRHIPGSPSVTPQNMPGASGLRAANYLYNVAPRDGTVLGLVTQTVALEKLLGTPNVEYQADGFGWIGRIEVDDDVLVSWRTSKVKSIDDAWREVAVLSGSNSGISMPTILSHVIGAKFKIITGYSGSSDNLLNMERGEIDATSTSLSALEATHPQWLADKTVNLLVQFSPERHSDLPSVPDMVEVGRTPDQKSVLSLYARGAAIGKSIFAPPGIPPDRLAVLRDAFNRSMMDPDFLSEAHRMNLETDPLPGEDLQRGIADLNNVSPMVLKEAISARLSH